MQAKFIQTGNSIDYTPSSDVSAGDVVIVGNIVGIAKLDIPANTAGAISLTGCFQIYKDDVDISIGDAIYWDETESLATTASYGNTFIGRSVTAQIAADPSVIVRLEQPTVSEGASS